VQGARIDEGISASTHEKPKGMKRIPMAPTSPHVPKYVTFVEDVIPFLLYYQHLYPSWLLFNQQVG
jgi:hypothetical protein